MKRILSFVLLVIVAASSIWAQPANVTIKGTTVNGAGKEIELYKYTDQLSQREVLLDKMIINAEQSFELHTYCNYPTLVFLQIENYSQSFYIEAGRTYEIYIRRFDWDIDEQRNVFLDPEVLPLEFLNLPANELNLCINHFDAVVDSFVQANIYHFDKKFHPSKHYFDTLVMTVDKLAPDNDNEFYNRYKRYSLAQMRYSLHFDSRRNLINQYIKDQPIMYYDDNYMALFFALYANSISKGTRKIPVYRLTEWVNGRDLSTMLDSLGLDPLLRNEQIRELAALQAFKEAYFNSRYYDGQNVMQMIEMLAGRTKFPEHKKLAENLLGGFRAMQKGNEVPTFTLPNVDKQMVSLDDFKGKWVYLSFVRVGDPNSLSEVETLAHFKDSVYAHSNNVEFITIACDREFQKMYHFLKNNKKGNRYNWTWLHFNNNFKLLEHFQVVSYPTFLLINPQGKLQYNVTPAPASGFLLSPPWQPKKQEAQQDFFLGN